jgi:hypothetical protein
VTALSASGDHARSELFEGGYYSIIDGESFGVAKILRIDPQIVHVRIYKEHFNQRPRAIDPAKLSLGSIHDEDGFGMGHLPLRTQTFADREPVFITHLPVTDNELQGYNMWKEADGGVWE